MIKVGIIGSTGYAGQEIVRILLRHPEAKIVWYGSRSYIDKRYSEVFGNMFRLVEDVCKGENMQELADQNAKLTGCVLNDTPAVSHSKRYGYGQYGYGKYGYGKTGYKKYGYGRDKAGD